MVGRMTNGLLYIREMSDRHQAADRVDRRPNRDGFTLVELLVVIAIIGILVALLLPAIQAAREAARRSQCKNNLKQLALGILNHYDVQKHFPTGGWGWLYVGDPDRGYGKDQPGGWIYNILPFIEEGRLHDMASDGNPSALTTPQTTATQDLLAHPITIINCPTRRPTAAYPYNNPNGVGILNSRMPTVCGRSDYAINSGTLYNEFGKGPNNYADTQNWNKSNLWPSQDKAVLSYLNGVSNQLSLVTLQQITDGTSHTYMVGEKYINSGKYDTGGDSGDNESWCTGTNNDNYRVTGYQAVNGGPVLGIPPLQDQPMDSPPGFPNPVYPGGPEPATRTFGSAHSGGFQMALCDGSVTLIPYDVDLTVHRDLGDRQDGNVHDAP
jgi:prepilin-type N-terminal cleavage/methylation domain-containing protein